MDKWEWYRHCADERAEDISKIVTRAEMEMTPEKWGDIFRKQKLMTKDEAREILFQTEYGKTTLMQRLEAWQKYMPKNEHEPVEMILRDLAHGIYWLLEDKFKIEK